jgi:long-subunit acyl-CoA synthetase (AMP-forming)/GNAT superfamily N-acetyltransferase
VSPELLSRVQDAFAALESGSPADPATATVTLVRATREAVRALERMTASLTEETDSDRGDVRAHRSLVHRILDDAGHRSVSTAFAESPFAKEWTDLLLEAVLASDYTVGDLFFSRARALGDRTLFLLPPGRKEGRVSWVEAERRVVRIGRALLAARDRGEVGPEAGPVAILGPNSPELALFDLACLVVGIPNVPVPANSPPDQIEFILVHAKATALFLGDDAAARAAAGAIAARGDALRVHWIDGRRPEALPVRSLEEFLAKGDTVPEERVREEAFRVRSADLATTMYTSGTTGVPRGIPFTQGNLVTKRFARAAAWPDLGTGDVFLCYLPLYHTFGRWLEMLGCVFWGAVYAFLEDVSLESLLYSFQRVRPTAFISVPKKWIQIAESVGPGGEDALDDAASPDEREISRELVRVTGGRLRRGLSAAGYLPPWIFRRFHGADIELHSGFGMTEATGGITMTPEGDYRDESIGVALPGIELKVAEDGELFIRGPYVTPESEDEPPRVEGWLATGDIVRSDAEGHYRIVDRKKEIFKNIQGETISPRRIESLFADFEIVERVVVIGDDRPYCTALIVPTAELRSEFAADANAFTIDTPDLRERFAPVVSSVNGFLAPYERVLDFAVLARDLDPDRGELTAKGTPRRNVLVDRFRDAIEPLYSREAVQRTIGEVTVRVPHWFLRQTGIPPTELRATPEGLEAGSSARLSIRPGTGEGCVIVGDLEYDPGGGEVRLGEIVGRAELWLGNDMVRRFAGPGIDHWWRRGPRLDVRTRLVSRLVAGAAPPEDPSRRTELPPREPSGSPVDLANLHAWVRGLSSPDPDVRRETVEALRKDLTGENPERDSLVRRVLRSGLSDTPIRPHCLRAIIPGLAPEELDRAIEEGIADPTFLSEDEIRIAAESPLRGDQLDYLMHRIRDSAPADEEKRWPERMPGLLRRLRFLVELAIRHRANLLRVRSLLADLIARSRDPGRTEELETLFSRLECGFLERLPETQVAPGVPWRGAVFFRGEVEENHQDRILDAISRTKLLAEALALLGATPPRSPLLLSSRSVRISRLAPSRGRTVYLLAWSPAGLDRTAPRFECVLKVNESLDWEKIREERRLLVRMRTGGTGRPVVKAQGGAYPEQGLWTEEYIPGPTLDRLVEDLVREEDERTTGRLPELWQFLVSSCASLVVDAWRRTGSTQTLANPSPRMVVLPPRDWQVGGRLVSVANRKRCERLIDVLESVRQGIIRPLHERFGSAGLESERRLLLSGALEAIGEEEGLAILEREAPPDSAASRFVSSVRRRGFLPVHIRIAARRYRRWCHLNADATLQAQAATLDQVAAAYGLGELDVERPGSRLQFYRHTVFRGTDDRFMRAFDAIIADTLARSATGDRPPRGAATSGPPGRWHRELADLRERFPLTDRQEFFLAQTLYPHVDPEGKAMLVRERAEGAGHGTGMEVTYQDAEGEEFRIHPPRNPNEVGALSRVFRAANFRRVPSAEQDELLVVTQAQGRVIGGLIFHRPSATYAHLEWLVVSRHRRGRGIGAVLLREFLDRVKAQGVLAVSTGFFHRQFFARFDFVIDPRYAGQVRILGGEETGDPTAPDSGDVTEIR